ncbi:hypothetical protein FWF93_02275 [Candidatus Saccharibacteria bacterium]|jgi:hypothetical protein|nr:hypothetical protein [Candidatus Saccharibacteria bacterium]
MGQPEKKSGENNFAKFILFCVIIALILVTLGLCLYRSTGTQDLDRSLPKYVLGEK